MHIFTKKVQAKHNQTPRDIYFNNLEEAYGSLPVPSDDWADIKNLIKNNTKLDEEMEIFKLEEAIEVIRKHYELTAKLLKKTQLYG